MKPFFRFFAERSLLAYIITLLIILMGAGTLLTIKRDNFPTVEFGEVLITTQFPGASPEDVELKVSNEIEKEIKEVTGIDRYQSWSMENVSIVHIVLDPHEAARDKCHPAQQRNGCNADPVIFSDHISHSYIGPFNRTSRAPARSQDT
ncbi:MAG: efflux RND transporter permease subunit [Alphaproteobacteria bacterium]|nr:efflux RND transporter permease subunit [Alphaproteobacteria bacterium]